MPSIGALIALAIVLIAVGGILALLIAGAFEDPASPNPWPSWEAVLTDRAFLGRLAYSLLQALAATALGLVLGLPASWVLSRGGVPLRGVLVFLVAAPLAVPGVVVGLGVDVLAGDELPARVLVIAAHATFATAAVTWLVTPAWSAGNLTAGEDARTLGAGRLRAYLVGPGCHLPGAVRVAAALAFWYAFAAAGTVAILGGTDATTTESMLAFGAPAPAPATAPATVTAAGTGISTGIGTPEVTPALSVVALLQLLVGLAAFTLGGVRWPGAAARHPRITTAELWLGTVYVAALVVVLWAPPGAVLAEALSEGARSLRSLADARIGGHEATALLGWTAVLALLSALVATPLAWLGARHLAPQHLGTQHLGPQHLGTRHVATPGRARRDALAAWAIALPAALTGATAAWAGVVLADYLGIDLDRTYALAAGAHALIAYPFALRILARRPSVTTAMLEDAVLLGEPLGSVRWRWLGRGTAQALASAFLVAMVLSAGEVAAAALLVPDDATPAALGLLQGWAGGGSPGSGARQVGGETYALGAVLAATTVVAFAVAEWLRRAAARVEAG